MGVEYMKFYNSFKWTSFKHLTYRFHGSYGNIKYFTVYFQKNEEGKERVKV